MVFLSFPNNFKKSGIQMKRGIILLAVILAIGLIFFLSSQNNNFMTSFAAKTDGIDVNIDLFPLSRELEAGDDVRTSVRIDTHRDDIVDVTLSYTITNDKGLLVFQKSETLAVRRAAKVADNLVIHRTLGPGSYLVEVEAIYDNNVKKERDTFTVVGLPSELSKYDSAMLLILIILIIIFVILLWIHNRKVNKMVKAHEKCDIEHVMKL